MTAGMPGVRQKSGRHLGCGEHPMRLDDLSQPATLAKQHVTVARALAYPMSP